MPGYSLSSKGFMLNKDRLIQIKVYHDIVSNDRLITFELAKVLC